MFWFIRIRKKPFMVRQYKAKEKEPFTGLQLLCLENYKIKHKLFHKDFIVKSRKGAICPESILVSLNDKVEFFENFNDANNCFNKISSHKKVPIKKENKK